MIPLAIRDIHVLVYMRTRGFVTFADLQAALGAETCSKFRLAKLVDAGLIAKRGKTKGAKYGAVAAEQLANSDLETMIDVIEALPGAVLLDLFAQVKDKKKYVELCAEVLDGLVAMEPTGARARKVLAMAAMLVRLDENTQNEVFREFASKGIFDDHLFARIAVGDVVVDTMSRLEFDREQVRDKLLVERERAGGTYGTDIV